MEISSLIINWYTKHKRNLPWRRRKNPYEVWLSEIILQQTKVSQGLGYYNNFINRFPKLEDLALAKEDDVMKMWQGLGYYSRARYLHQSAKHVYFELDNIFPDTYAKLIRLKGIGPYTAAAISSICFNKSHAVVDGNVYRVLARVFEIKTPINSTKGINEFQKLANQLIARDNPGDYNQGIMELGATVCTPKNANCHACPLNEKCLSRSKNSLYTFPVKNKLIKIKKRYIFYYCINWKDKIWVNKRELNDIWKQLYDFPYFETTSPIKGNNKEYHLNNITNLIGKCKHIKLSQTEYKHKLTHQILHITISTVFLDDNPIKNIEKFIPKEQLKQLPVPKPIDMFIKNHIQ